MLCEEVFGNDVVKACEMRRPRVIHRRRRRQDNVRDERGKCMQRLAESSVAEAARRTE